MNVAHIKAKLLAFRAEVDEMIDKLDGAEGDEVERSPWMTVSEYAAHAGVHPDTVRRSWLAKGMPHAKGPLRIHFIDADAWRKEQ
jgi:hypothetical protein